LVLKNVKATFSRERLDAVLEIERVQGSFDFALKRCAALRFLRGASLRMTGF
jgi:hypothetical protein